MRKWEIGKTEVEKIRKLRRFEGEGREHRV
jgi:hypothetical protein